MAPRVLYRVSYGNANPQPWQQKLTTVRPALLESYRRHRVKYMSYPAIVPCTGSSVRGSVVTGLTEGDICWLDIFAGDRYEQEKVKVKVLKDVGQNGAVEAHATEEVEAENLRLERRPKRT
jgi:Gamma-glutamyl cyclotransferase, AIG2-like